MAIPDANDPLRTVEAPLAFGDTGRSDQTVERKTTPESGSATVSITGYEIESILGRGGMGVVYKAQHTVLKRTVALKMILAGGHAGPRELARFRIEAEAVARLQHPNIVQIHEVGESGGHPYCALEFVDGGNLADKIANKPLPAADAAKLIEALARAMQLAHSRNVVHRDLKPANILLTADGTPKITDFGLARQMDSDSGETQTGAVMGTPSYMAPEQASGRTHEAGPAADVYALGAILFACLAGRPPFKGTSVVETLDLVRNQEPVPPPHWQSTVPLDLATICFKCLRKLPEQRYSSAAELADDLGRYQRGEPIAARPVGSLERAAKWVRRRPVGAALITAVALILLGIPTAAVAFAEYSRKKSDELAAKNNELVLEQAETGKALKKSRVSEARRALTLGLNLCDQGDIAKGLVALTHALAAAVVAEDSDLESAIRFNLASWEREVWRLRAVMPPPDGTETMDVALHPEGTMVAVALTNQTVQLWSATEGKEGQLLQTFSHTGDAGGIEYRVRFSVDGRLLMLRTEKAVFIWNTTTGEPACPSLRHETPISAVALDPMGKFILTGDERGAARLWSTTTGKQVGEPYKHKTAITTISFRGDGTQALTGSIDGLAGC